LPKFYIAAPVRNFAAMWGSIGVSQGEEEPVTRAEYQKLEARVRKAEGSVKQLQQQIQAIGMFGMGGGMASMGGMGMNSMGAMGAMGGMGGMGAMGGMGMGFGAAGDHSRSPRGRQPVGTGVANQTATEFALSNGIDENCLEALMAQPEDVQNYVISQGPVEGRNPSAMVMSRIARAGGTGSAGGPPGQYSPAQAQPWAGEDVTTKVEEFIIENGLDDKCAAMLRAKAPAIQAMVINQGPAVGQARNSSALVVGRIIKASQGGM